MAEEAGRRGRKKGAKVGLIGPRVYMIGKTFGQWTVLEPYYKDKTYRECSCGCLNHLYPTFFKCRCSCGRMGIIRGAPLRGGKTLRCKSCAGKMKVHKKKAQPNKEV